MSPNNQQPNPAPTPVPPQPVMPLTPVPPAGSLLPPQPAAPQQPPAQPAPNPVPPAAQPPKKKKALWIVLILSAIALLVVASIAYVIIKKPKQYTGNYTRFATQEGESPDEGVTYKFKYPVNMVKTRDESSKVTFEQKVKPDQLLKTQQGWESQIRYSAIDGDFTSFSNTFSKEGLSSTNETITYLASIHKKVMEEDGYTNVSTRNREDLSNTDSGKIIYEYQYTDKNNVVIKGRTVLYLTKTNITNLFIEAIDKIWDKNTPAWDDITDSFEVQYP